mmetsp:Transcript_33006/g.45307  ORF Transcript_33006/g.45307 Transcript_33006/m.45307 type:complete len:624 (+) Transcript_33006:140-2011(+)
MWNLAARSYSTASDLFMKGELDSSAHYFSLLLPIMGDVYPTIYMDYAVVLDKLNRKEDALKLYQEGGQKHPKNQQLFLHYCRFCGHSVQNYYRNAYKCEFQVAVDACKTAIELNPNNFEGYQVLGATLANFQEYELALANLKSAYLLVGDDKHHHVAILQNLATISLRAGHNKDALEFSDLLLEKGEIANPAHVRCVLLPFDKLAVELQRSTLISETSRCSKFSLCNKNSWNLVWNWRDINHPGVTIKTVNEMKRGNLFGPPMTRPQVQGVQFSEKDVRYGDSEIYHITSSSSAILWNAQGNVRFGCDVVLGQYGGWTKTEDLCPEFPKTVKKTFKTPLLVTLPLYNPRNYFHWAAESLPRLVTLLDIMEQKGVTNFKILTPPVARFVEETVQLLGIDLSRIVAFEPGNEETWELEGEVHFVDWHYPLSSIYADDSWSFFYPPREALLNTRKKLHSIVDALEEKEERENGKEKKEKEERKKVLYVSREFGSARKIENENVLIERLRKEVESMGATLLVHNGKESFLEQINLFRSAHLVVGPHGAGLSNLMFCSPGVKLILFPMDPKADQTFEYMARALDIPVQLVSDVTSAYYQSYGVLSEKKFQSIFSALRQMMKEKEKEEL